MKIGPTTFINCKKQLSPFPFTHLYPSRKEVEEDRELRKALFDLYLWKQGQDSFTCQLYGLMAKADCNNFSKLALAFPVEARAFQIWYNSNESEQKFFEYILNTDID